MRNNKIIKNVCLSTLFLMMTVMLSGCKSPSLVTSTTVQEKINLEGSSWKMTQRADGLDGAPTITFVKILRFVDASKLIIEENTDYSSASGSYKRDDGTVPYYPAHSESKTKTGTYIIKDNTIQAKFEKEEVTYYLRDKNIIISVNDQEYESMSDFNKKFYTYVLVQ